MSDMDCLVDAADIGFRQALERVEPQLERMTTAQLRTITLNPVAAGVTLRRVLPSIRALRPQLLGLEQFDIRLLDELEVYLHAWLAANASYLGTKPSADEFTVRVKRLTAFRCHFTSDAKALVQRGRLQAAAFDQLKGATGYKNITRDVLTLTTLFREHWDDLAGYSCVTLTELDEADAAVDDFITALALRNETSPDRSAADALRQKAYTLFVNAYDQVRRAVMYLRQKERDADEIAPSLFAAQNRKM